MDIGQDPLLSHLLKIDEYEFEKFIADVWERYNWETEVTRGSNDRGVDVIAEKRSPVYQKHLIQVKRWGSDNKIGGREIREYSSLRQKNSVDAVVVVTTSSFTQQGIEEAEDLNVKLVDGSNLYDIISKIDAKVLINEYTTLDESDSENESSKEGEHGASSSDTTKQEPTKGDKESTPISSEQSDRKIKYTEKVEEYDKEFDRETY